MAPARPRSHWRPLTSCSMTSPPPCGCARAGYVVPTFTARWRHLIINTTRSRTVLPDERFRVAQLTNKRSTTTKMYINGHWWFSHTHTRTHREKKISCETWNKWGARFHHHFTTTCIIVHFTFSNYTFMIHAHTHSCY